MHNYNGEKTVFNFNSDLSGDVYVTDKRTGDEVKIDGKDLLRFVAGHVISERIAALESMDPIEILGLRR